MKYEYKTITIATNVEVLNQYYAEGWEFVNSITQVVKFTYDNGGFTFFTLRRAL